MVKLRSQQSPHILRNNLRKSTIVADVVELLEWNPPLLGSWCHAVDQEPDPEYLLEGLLPADELVIISGPAKRAMKTYFAIALAGTVATGEEYSELRPVNCDGVPTLMILQEGTRKGTRRRFARFSKSLGLEMEHCPHLYIEHRNADLLIDRPQWVDRISQFVRQKKIRFLIVDTLAMVSQHDENRVEDVMHTMRCLHKIREAYKCTVCFIHHTRKVMEKAGVMDIDEDTRGSSSMAGIYGAHFGLRKRSMNQTHIDLTVRQKEAEDQLFKVEWSIDDNAAHLELVPVDDKQRFEDLVENAKRSLVPGQIYLKKHFAEIAGSSAEGRRVFEELIRLNVLIKDGKDYVYEA